MDLPSLFREQVRWCATLGSPFTAALLERAARDVEEGGVLADVLSAREWLPTDAMPLRFAGALRMAAMRDERLRALYPPAATDMERIWARASDLMRADRVFFDQVLQSAPQTNETRRAIALLPAFLSVANGAAPLHMLELGASAGLNLSWDKFAYETDAWSWPAHAAADAPLIDTEWRGPAPAYLGPLNVVSRAGCDLNPMDVGDPGQRTRLAAYIWADQAERIARFERAADLAIRENTRVERADAAAWVNEKLSGKLPAGVTILYHSVVWQYFPEETKARVIAAIEAAGAGADGDHRLAWVRFEHDRVLGMEGDSYGVDVKTWPGGERKIIARADPHVRWVEMV
jgi:hypothetical protein